MSVWVNGKARMKTPTEAGGTLRRASMFELRRVGDPSWRRRDTGDPLDVKRSSTRLRIFVVPSAKLVH